MNRRVVVTGLGLVCPLGVGVEHAWKRLIAGECGITKLDERFDLLPSKVAGLIPKGSKDQGKWDANDWIDKANLRRVPLFGQYAVAAARQALDDAQWAPQVEEDCEMTGVAVGSGIGGFDSLYENVTNYSNHGYKKVSPLFIPNLLNNMASGHISLFNKFKGPNHSVSTACTTGAHAIGDATNFIRQGMANVMVAGSSEAPIHPLSVAGFARAKSLSTKYNEEPEKSSRPFDSDRGGFVIGEGSGIIVLEEFEHAVQRGAKIYCEVGGYGLSGDAHHITAPMENGDGAYRSMKMALKNANVKPELVDYVNAHATSTQLGDIAESNAITRLLGGSSENRDPSSINISSTKGATGHLLGGAGSVEAVFTILAMHHNTLPPTLNLDTINPEFQCNYVPLESQQCNINTAITNSFGFGGTNATILFQRV